MQLTGPDDPTHQDGVILLNYERFHQICTILGASSCAAQAQLVGVATRTIFRARDGGPVSGALIAGVLITLGRHQARLAAAGHTVSFTALFRVEIRDH